MNSNYLDTTSAISIQGVSKCYQSGAGFDQRLGEDMLRRLKRWVGRGPVLAPPVWALRDIDLEIAQGSVLGIIGHNGAGKSTLLKLLAGITQPTAGRIVLRGQRTSILEIGTGFHPDLTGRQNVALAAAVAGLPSRELRSRFDAIVDFSGIAGAIDQPVKHYSSGMYLRLAFSVAFHTNSDILLLDEVLSVGDLEFRMRSAEKVREIAASGATVVLCSHELPAISKLCTEAVILSQGRVQDKGRPKDIVERYVSGYFDRKHPAQGQDGRSPWPQHPDFELLAVSIRAQGKEEGAPITKEDFIEFQFDYRKSSAGKEIGLYLIISEYDNFLFSDCGQFRAAYPMSEQGPGVYAVRTVLPPYLLNAGSYYVHLQIGREYRLVFSMNYVQKFTVELPAWECDMPWNGGTQLTPLRLQLDWKLERLGN
jgi:lipopolysaccharide transport system ATP-binding protein